MKFIAAVLVCAGGLTSVTLLADGPPVDQDQLQGEWTLLKGETNGRPMAEALGANGIKNFQITFDGDVMTMSGQGGPQFTYRYQLDPSQTPKHFDSTPIKTPKKIREAPTIPGVYRLDGDTLTLCLTRGPDDPHPEEFSAPKGSRRSVLILKRVAKATK